jgi:hypothetical protein
VLVAREWESRLDRVLKAEQLRVPAGANMAPRERLLASGSRFGCDGPADVSSSRAQNLGQSERSVPLSCLTCPADRGLG